MATRPKRKQTANAAIPRGARSMDEGRAGARLGVQRNKDDEPGQPRPNRSPRQSNANEPTPSLQEDFMRTQRADNERMNRGINPPNPRPQNVAQNISAGNRAEARTIGRTNRVGGAAVGAYLLTKASMALAEKAGEKGYQIGKGIAEKEQQSKVENIVNRGKFESLMNRPESTPKQAAKKVSMSDIPKAAPAPKAKAAAPAPKMQERGVREGPNENIGDDTRARAMASVAKLEDVNKKNKWKGVME